MIPEGARRIDPDAEMARLAEARKAATEFPLVAGEVHPALIGGGLCSLRISVGISGDPRGLEVPALLGAALAARLRALLGSPEPGTPAWDAARDGGGDD